MLLVGIAATIFLCFLPSQVDGLNTTDAKCLSGYDWMFSSNGQSPCDIAAELAGVCTDARFNILPLRTGYVYLGPPVANATSCRCSSVYYTLLSACAHCQGRNYLEWSAYNPNCSTVYVATYVREIPDGVNVPAYAYQNVSISDTFNVTLAQSVRGVESTRLPSSSSSSSPAAASSSTTTSDD